MLPVHNTPASPSPQPNRISSGASQAAHISGAFAHGYPTKAGQLRVPHAAAGGEKSGAVHKHHSSQNSSELFIIRPEIVGERFKKLPGCRYTCEMMKKLRFLVSLHTRENDFQVAQAQSAEDTARKLGSDAEIVFADNDAVNQSTQLLKAIQSRVESRPDAIVVEPIGGTALPQVARAASAAGIGWAVRVGDPITCPTPAPPRPHPSLLSVPITSRLDAFKEGNSQRCCPEAVPLCTLKDLPTVPRPKNVRPALQTKPPNIQAAMLKAQWTEESAVRALRSWLKLATSQSASFDLVGAQDDSMAMGARKAFQEISNEAERSRWLSLPFTGCSLK